LSGYSVENPAAQRALGRFAIYERFGWTPDELDEAPADEVEDILTIMETEARIMAAKRRAGG
jgi:hypothetical protein